MRGFCNHSTKQTLESVSTKLITDVKQNIHQYYCEFLLKKNKKNTEHGILVFMKRLTFREHIFSSHHLCTSAKILTHTEVPSNKYFLCPCGMRSTYTVWVSSYQWSGKVPVGRSHKGSSVHLRLQCWGMRIHQHFWTEGNGEYCGPAKSHALCQTGQHLRQRWVALHLLAGIWGITEQVTGTVSVT